MSLRMFTGLRSEIAINVTVLAIIAILLVGTLTIQSIQQGYLSQQILDARRKMAILIFALNELDDATQPRIPADARSRGRRLLAGLMKEDALQLVWVDREGRVLSGGPKAPAVDGRVDRDLKASLVLGEEVMRLVGAGGPWPFAGPKTLVLAAPMRSPNGEVRGALRMEIPMTTVAESLLRARWVLGLYFLMVMMILIAFGSYLISRNVLNPLKRLIRVSERIAKGDYDIVWERYPRHEMGRLAEALHRMAQSLQENQQALVAKVQDLDRANKALVEAQQALVRSEKLATVGRLSAGVAHEIGNPLGSILGYVEILLGEIRDQTASDCLRRVRNEAERIQRTIRSLLDLARPAPQKWQWVDVEALVDETLVLVAGHEGAKGIDLHWSPEGTVQRIWADRDQVQQVLVNLLLNAVDALGGRGSLEVRVGNASHIPRGRAAPMVPKRRKGDPTGQDYTHMRNTQAFGGAVGDCPCIFIAVEDTGSGIREEDMPHLFEPFFTTKEPGKGTGLGLAICHGIVESYGGVIQLQSRQGQGSCFTVYLPVGGPQEGEGESEQGQRGS